MDKDIPIRSPTGRAWLSSVVTFIVAGELLYEVRKEVPAVFFKIPFTDSELIPWIILFGLTALVSIAWLISLYLKPGRLVLDPDAGIVRRVRRRLLRGQVVEAPAKEWEIRVVYFSEEHRNKGVFKRIELVGPDYQEVLLFTDLKRGETLAQALETMSGAFGKLTIDVEQAVEAA